jgi:hypothetical protein
MSLRRYFTARFFILFHRLLIKNLFKIVAATCSGAVAKYAALGAVFSFAHEP